MAELPIPPLIPIKAARFVFLLLSPSGRLRNTAVADEIFTSASGVAFGRSSREPKYKIEFHPADSPFHPDSGQELAAIVQQREAGFHVFYLPIVEEPKTVRPITQQNSSGIVIEADRKIKLKTRTS